METIGRESPGAPSLGGCEEDWRSALGPGRDPTRPCWPMRVYIYMYIYIYICIYIYVYIYVYICIHIYLYIYMCIYIYTYVYTCTYICINVLVLYMNTICQVFVEIFCKYSSSPARPTRNCFTGTKGPRVWLATTVVLALSLCRRPVRHCAAAV